MRKLVALLTFGLLATPALAINTPHVAGDFQGWDPGANPMTETPPDSGIYQASFSDLGTNGRHVFKITDGTWDNSLPGANSWLYADSSGLITITYNSNGVADGWSPTIDRLGLSHDPGAWTAVGNWQAQVGGGDWDNANPNTAMVDQGGGIYRLEATLAPGTYDWKAVVTGTWDSISWDARSTNTANWSFSVTVDEPVVRFWVDALEGKAKWETLPGVAPLPPSHLASLYVAKDSTWQMLRVGVAGNLQSNTSAMVIFIDRPELDGQSELQADGVPTGHDHLQAASKRMDLIDCQFVGNGTFVPGAEVDFGVFANYQGDGRLYFDEYIFYDPATTAPPAPNSMTCCDGTTFDVWSDTAYIGATDVIDTNGADDQLEDEVISYKGGFNDSNTNGRWDEVTTGLEVGIPYARLGGPLGNFNLFVALLPTNNGVTGQFSNHMLPAVNTNGAYCDPAEMFPLRADLRTFASVASFTLATLPEFGGGDGLSDGVIDPNDYSGTADELQACDAVFPEQDSTVSLQPADPVQGNDVVLWYISTNGPLEGSESVYLHYSYNEWMAGPFVVPMTATNGLTGSEWIAPLHLDSNGYLQLDAFFSSSNGIPTNGIEHDNHTQDWHLPFGWPPVSAATVEGDPDPLLAGALATIIYDPGGRPLAGADSVNMTYGWNDWSTHASDGVALTQDPTDCLWKVDIMIDPIASGPLGFECALFSDGGTWDNNDGNNFNLYVENLGPPTPFAMDGCLDACAVDLGFVSSNGAQHLYAAFIDPWLYVATEASGFSGNDHFIFLNTNGVGALAAHPWGKTGQVAEHDGRLCNEADNGWKGWQGVTGEAGGINDQSAEYLEGRINVDSQFDSLTEIYMAFGAWESPGGGTMVSDLQVPNPPGANDINISIDEFTLVTFASLTPTYDAADFDESCVVDLDDYLEFQKCVNGPGNAPGGGCTVDADLDNDGGDVDLKDYQLFQLAYTACD